MTSTIRRIAAATTRKAHAAATLTAKKARTAVTASGRHVLSRALNYYRLNAEDKRNLMNAYNKYWQARNNTRSVNARRNAKVAGTKLANAMFRMYNKQISKSTAVSNGLQNGVYRSMIYWLPGILVRHTVRYRRASA